MNDNQPSIIDHLYTLLTVDNVPKVRRNVNRFLKRCHSNLNLTGPVLDIGPADDGLSEVLFNTEAFQYKSLNLSADSQPDFVADICQMPQVPESSFSTIICTEVLEHTLNPFNAVSELHRILKPNGFLLVSTPFDLRIHGPHPDCWRFTDDGLRTLFRNKFIIVELKPLKQIFRPMMPVHYTVILQKQ